MIFGAAMASMPSRCKSMCRSANRCRRLSFLVDAVVWSQSAAFGERGFCSHWLVHGRSVRVCLHFSSRVS